MSSATGINLFLTAAHQWGFSIAMAAFYAPYAPYAGLPPAKGHPVPCVSKSLCCCSPHLRYAVLVQCPVFPLRGCKGMEEPTRVAPFSLLCPMPFELRDPLPLPEGHWVAWKAQQRELGCLEGTMERAGHWVAWKAQWREKGNPRGHWAE